MGEVAIYPLPPGGSPCFPAEGKIRSAHEWAVWLHDPYRLGGPRRFKAEGRIGSAHKWARWLHDLYRWGVGIASERGQNQK